MARAGEAMPKSVVEFDAQASETSAAVPQQVVDQFSAEWESSGLPPDFDTFLPDADAIRRSALIDMIRVDLEHRWLHARLPKRLTEYCAEFPELRLDRLPPDLIRHEFVCRKRSGDHVDSKAYLQEFPVQAGRLKRLLDIHDDASTARVTEPLVQPRRTDALDDVGVGQRVDEFDLLTGLGSGAFARVFLARQRSMQRLVAVKISEDHGTEPQTLAQLDHDYIVRVFDQRVLPEEGLRLLYMQYLPGGTLLGVLHKLRKTTWTAGRTGQLLLDAIDEAMEAKGELRPTDSSIRTELANLSWPETIAWLGRRLAEALDYAGRHNVLHRDIKPANVLLTAEGVPKLADFNISFSGSSKGAGATAYFGGSLSYMSPEQLEACHPGKRTGAADLDTRSDIYSLGVVLWELLTGRRPFGDLEPQSGTEPGDATTIDSMLGCRLHGIGSDALASLPPDTPQTLRRILLTCLEPNPNDRWSSGAELASQFDLCLDAHARDLVDPPPGSWRLLLRPWSILIMELGVVVPNALAAYLKYHTDRALIVDELMGAPPHRFDVVWLIVMGVAFPLGAFVIFYMRRYLVLVPQGLRRGKIYSPRTLARARTDALLLGDRVVAVLFAIWIVCCVCWAGAMWIGMGDVPIRGYVYAFASAVICAAVAVVYPFFLVSFYAVRCLYPTFLPHGEVSGHDSELMEGLHRRSVRYLAVAAAVPLVGVAGATFIPLDEIGAVIGPIRTLSIVGVVAFIGAYWLFRKVEGDLIALERVTSRQQDPIGNT
ncbi:serine/threonine-protein kinase [Antrihabitans stalactiti]|nr:serine/threonine-protein kinase [Antrihabitans stalactiti]